MGYGGEAGAIPDRVVVRPMDLLEVPGTTFHRHPWEIARASFFRRILADAGLFTAPRAVLDVGAGDGYLARSLLATLPAGSTAVCLDAHYRDDDLARFADPPAVGLSFARQRPAYRFDIILMLDVIEHVDDDRGFVAGFVNDSLAPAGVVLASVPAWPGLYGEHDRALKHFRRYSPAACRALLADAGLEVRASGGVFHALLVPRAIALLVERAQRAFGRPAAAPADLGDWHHGAFVSRLVAGGLAVDNAVTHLGRRLGWTLPGLSFWALCRAATPERPSA
jgi:SAM-dependent methyltransferase